tara:strand:- start:60 stop:1970 length:1911 start_codon:yes stop_codon:yes gene_type:complete
MGTSLSGLTPKDTYPALLKTSDNTIINSTLKTISDGSGDDTVLQLSTLRVGIKSDSTVTTQTSSVIQSTTNNANLVITPTGNGALLADIPDGTINGGNARGLLAVDLQMKGRTNANQVASGQQSVIIGGYNNRASGLFSTAGGGQNAATNQYATCIGGGFNTSSGGFSIVAGGSTNTASSDYATVSGGQSNVASTNTHATVVGGQSNVASGPHAVVAGGLTNNAAGTRSAIGGGQFNSIAAGYTVIGGGANNTNNTDYGTIGGGVTNSITNIFATSSVIAGGDTNRVLGGGGQVNQTIGGGGNNTTSSAYSTISGGQSNTASTNTHTTVVGGASNVASGQYSVAGGLTNTASGESSVALGRQNIASANKSASIGFNNNNTTQFGIAIGSDNTVTQGGGFQYAAVVGNNNSVTAGSRNYVFGEENVINSSGIRNTTIGYASTVTGTATNAMAINSGNSQATYNLTKGPAGIGYLFNAETRGGFTSLGGTQGTNQITTCIASNSTALTNAATQVLSLDGSGVTNLIIPRGNERAWNVQVNWVAVVQSITGTATGISVGDTITQVQTLGFKRIGGTSSLIGTANTLSTNANPSMSTASMAYTAGGSQEMAITFTAPTFAGAGSITCRVVARIELTEVAY